MGSHFIAYKKSLIHYCAWGSGLRLLFCFHGYGEDAESFSILADSLAGDYTIIALDFPFHGKTEWNEGLLFTVDELAEIMDAIKLAVNQAGKDSEVHYTIFGYSMGGRVALQFLQSQPQLVERLVLAAPDGLHKNKWYRLATQNIIGNKLFKFVMYGSKGHYLFLQMVEKLHIVRSGLLKVVHYYTDDEKERHKLYCRWTTMRKFKPNLLLLKQILKRHNTALRFLFGRYDKIILSSGADIFKDDTKHVQVHIIDAGHRLLQEKYLPFITKLFQQ